MRATAVALAAAILSLGVSLTVIGVRPDLTRGAAFLFSDEAANLFVAGALHDGTRLYDGVAYPYGPLAIGTYSAVAGMLGNTPLVYLWTIAVLAALSAGLAGSLVGRFAPRGLAIAVVTVGLLATMPQPGATIGGYTSSIYMPLERIALLTAALLWAPPGQRSVRTGLAIGLVLGACQGVRFGTGVVMLAAVAALDLLSTRSTFGAPLGRTLRASAVVAGGFVIAEVCWVAWAAVTLPPPVAAEFLLPLQMWETHRVAVGVPRWPTWGGWRMAATQYVLPLSAAVLAIAAAARWGRAGRDEGRWIAEGRAILLLLFFALGVAVFFRHEHHFRQFAWMLVPPAAVILTARRARWRSFALVACAPALWPIVSALAHGASPGAVALQVPRGYSLVVGPETAARVRFLDGFRGTGPVIVVPNGAGWLYAFDQANATRHTWFYSRAVVRPFEEQRFSGELLAADYVIACAPAVEGSWPLPLPAVEMIQSHFTTTASSSGCTAWARRR